MPAFAAAATLIWHLLGKNVDAIDTGLITAAPNIPVAGLRERVAADYFVAVCTQFTRAFGPR